MTARSVRRGVLFLSLLGLLAPVVPAGAAPRPVPAASTLQQVVPAPVSVTPDPAVRYLLGPATVVFTSGGADARQVGDYLAGLLRPATRFRVPVITAPALPGVPKALPGISLLLGGADSRVGAEGYTLDSTASGVTIRAAKPAGLFNGVQTLRQLLPASLSGTLTVPGGHILDYPRYSYRGAMLDVARHFLPVSDVKKYLDDIALYKVNNLHLHLTDDQGWRLQIDGWPNLTVKGASTGSGGGAGGFYTKAQYRDIVAYAQSRHITIVPEIDMPSHFGAALASYAELNCDGVAGPIYTGLTPAPRSDLCVDKPITYKFIGDVLSQLAALTPGGYLDVGGDEIQDLDDAQYTAFMAKIAPMVAKTGKKLLGWAEMLTATPPQGATGEFWIYDGTQNEVGQASQQGAKLIMAPCVYTYLDMKYAPGVPADIGLEWAGDISVQAAYGWDPTAVVPGALNSNIDGVEAPLWTDTVRSLDDVRLLAFPRLPAIAEIGWSPQASHDWTSFASRLAAQGPRWTALGVKYYAAPEIPWPKN
ncbi:beta-N-acetylhexosaminidase [Amycolatopsis sp. NPDC048633]|uniref:beta-N-acetylhexosaminidase n=1 Tax=Amycolatopsis sp. NPDC048633 TaxID=3157095 RepID=UPI0033C156F8